MPLRWRPYLYEKKGSGEIFLKKFPRVLRSSLFWKIELAKTTQKPKNAK